jgi:4-hydroxy-tetrahydrodipicolinate reductase
MTSATLKVAILGAGRMGQQLLEVVDEATDCQAAGVWSRTADTDLAALLASADVAIDFTLPEASKEIAGAAAVSGTPLVCGVTGLDRPAEDAIAAAARQIALLYDRNMSPGMGVMSQMVRHAAALLGRDFTSEIRETHHIHKKDAPSGTALALREALGDDSIRIESRREGEVLGDHLVRFASASESLEIAHSVGNRRVFAEGAVVAARWLVNQPPGLYSMTDIWSKG